MAKKSAPAKSSKKSQIGDVQVKYKAPKFKAVSTSGSEVALKDFKGRHLVVYFYPRDNTPGCTLEGQDFKKLYAAFQKLNCDILGVSQDSLASHDKFKSKCGFPFDLLADESGEMSRAFDVIHMKNMYGKKFEGIVRSTFVINQEGTVIGEWRKVKVAGHAQEVLDFVKENQK